MRSIGALIITRNEAANVSECLSTLQFCQERVVVDSFSEDETVELACQQAEHVYRRSFRNHADQKNWGMNQLDTEWVLIVDADERVPASLADELLEIAAGDGDDAYWLRRENRFFGHPIRGAGWGRDRVLRFFPRGKGHYPEADLHEEIEVAAGVAVQSCQNYLQHNSYSDWPSTFGRLLSYSTRGAAQRRNRGKRMGRARLIVSPGARFFRQYFVQGGWRDGAAGFALCAFAAVSIFLRGAKLAVGETEIERIGSGQAGPEGVETVQGRAANAWPGDRTP